jgi:hypothetical protein
MTEAEMDAHITENAEYEPLCYSCVKFKDCILMNWFKASCVDYKPVDFSLPELTLDMILHTYINEIYSPQEVVKVLEDEEYTYLGWINDNLSEAWQLDQRGLLTGFSTVYKDYSGSYTILVDTYRRYYCVDMGD